VRTSAQSADNILLLVNDKSSVSRRVAEYYAKKRAINDRQVLHIRTPVVDEIDRTTYSLLIEAPIATWLSRNSAQDRILYIVLTKDIPLRVTGTSGLEGTGASVDSELTLLYRKMAGRAVPIAGRLPNPYFQQARTTAAGFAPFSHARWYMYLVTRLDAFTEGEVMQMIDRASAPATSGTIVLDQRGTGNQIGDRWLEAASDALAAMGRQRQVKLERTTAVVTREPNVLGYYSWGSNDPAFKDRHLNLGFVPGSIAATFVSTDGRTLREPPASWSIGTWDQPTSFFAGSPQSLAGDLLREGATATAAHVGEPFLDGTIRPQVLFPAYLSGLNVAEAFYAAMPFLSWQTIVLGDPLCAPFRSAVVPKEEADPAIASETELPKYFSARRIEASMERPAGGPRATVEMMMAYETLLTHGERQKARAMVERILALDPTSTGADRALADLDASDGRYEQATARFEKILKASPGDVITLNNYAYFVATKLQRPADALQYAERAHSRAPKELGVIDTLAWIHHLHGDDKRAAELLDTELSAGMPTAEVLLHAATIHAAVGEIPVAEEQLQLALDANPDGATSEDANLARAAIANAKQKRGKAAPR